MRNTWLAALSITLAIWAVPARAQAVSSYTVAIYPPTAADPNTTAPFSMAVYPVAAVRCGQPTTTAPDPETNPTQGRFDDPANAALDCVVDVSAQLASLASGNAWKGAVRANTLTSSTPFSPFSNGFVMQVAHPCDGSPATSGSVVEGTRTVSWCRDDLDTNGQPTTITSWVIYVDGVKSTLSGVTTDGVPNAAGLKLYKASFAFVRGTHAVQIDAINAVGEAAKSASFSLTVTPPAAAPSASTIRSIQ